MTFPTDDCQVPSTRAARHGDSGLDPPKFGENVFVADVSDALDVPHVVNTTNPVVTACIQTTRCVGAIDDFGFLLDVDQHVERGFLTDTLLLTVRGLIHEIDAGGVLGRDFVDVKVVLHRGTDHEVPLGDLEGGYRGRWETYRIDVPISALKFPADPDPDLEPTGTSGRTPEAQANQVSFEFSGADVPLGPSTRMTFTIDWLALAPKVGSALAARPIMLANGWIGSAHSWDESAWIKSLDFEGVSYHVVELPGHGLVKDNAALVTGFAQDLARRFGVERIAIVSHSKGGVDSRESVQGQDDVAVLVMIATPNAGTPLADVASYRYPETRDLTPAAMANYNAGYIPNLGVTHVTASGDYDSFKAQALAAWMGPNDEVIPVASVNSLAYATPFPYVTKTTDVESQGICASKKLTNHSCLLFKQPIVDDILPAFLTMPGAKQFEDLAAGEPPAAAEAAVEEERGVQTIRTDTGTASAGTPQVHSVMVDQVDAVTFLVAFEDPSALEVALVAPDGARIDATTSSPDVTPLLATDLGPMSHTGFDVQHPTPGVWIVEVTGTAATASPSAAETEPTDPNAYAVGALTPLVPGVGVTLDARLERPILPAGGPVTVLATVTENGTPVSGVTVTAAVVAPDDAALPEVALTDDGTGSYSGLLADLTEQGSYDVKVSAARAEPAFTRERRLQAVLTPASSTLTGSVTDRGVDDDGDGLFEHLVIDVGLVVEVPATYRLTGTLRDVSSSVIEQVRAEVPLEAGPGSIALAFSGSLLFNGRVDGPYLVTDLALVNVDAAALVALGDPYTTGEYTHTQFQRPPALLTGSTADRGVNVPDKPLAPFEQLAIDVEVDLLAAAEVEADARLRAEDGKLLDTGSFSADLPAGRSQLSFTFSASSIFRGGVPGPYTLGELIIAGTTGTGAFGLTVEGAVAVTQAYALEDFAPSPSFTVGGTVSGLAGAGLVLELISGASTIPLTIRANGPFRFAFPRLFGGNEYEVRVRTQPVNPSQVCTVVNGSGVIGDADVSNIEVHCQ